LQQLKKQRNSQKKKRRKKGNFSKRKASPLQRRFVPTLHLTRLSLQACAMLIFFADLVDFANDKQIREIEEIRIALSRIHSQIQSRMSRECAAQE
jgi:hypothetical protein